MKVSILLAASLVLLTGCKNPIKFKGSLGVNTTTQIHTEEGSVEIRARSGAAQSHPPQIVTITFPATAIPPSTAASGVQRHRFGPVFA